MHAQYEWQPNGADAGQTLHALRFAAGKVPLAMIKSPAFVTGSSSPADTLIIVYVKRPRRLHEDGICYILILHI
jgi:hypothetical protein